MIACSSAAPQPWERGFKYLFGVYALSDRYFISFHDVIARQGFRTVAIIHENNVFHDEIGKAAAHWAERFGLDVVYRKPFTNSNSEFNDIVKVLQEKEPDSVVFSAYPTDSYRFLDYLKRSGFKPKALGMTIVPTYPDFYERVGTFAEGVFGVSQWEPDERIPFPGTAIFIEDFQRFSNREPSYHAGSAYASCQLLEQAVTKIGDIEHEKIRDYIHSLDGMTVIGRFKVDETGRQIGHSPILIQWQGGKKEIVHPRKMRTTRPIFQSGLNQK
jgi:branched-chain amino acid transport system substrate-binding protein